MVSAVQTLTSEAVFLDRDGVIIENCDNYVRSWDDVEILPGALDALVKLADSHYKVFIVTNQQCVGKGIVSENFARSINNRLIDIIHDYGGRVDFAQICPHLSSERCECRKPEPGMLLTAANKFDVDLTQSWMIGDAVTDVQAGLAAGTQPLLLQTGRGRKQQQLLQKNDLADTPVFTDLSAAVDYLLAE